MARGLALICALAAILLHAGAGLAGGEKGDPVIPAGRERQVLELFQPYGLGDEIVAGQRLDDVAIQTAEIRIEITGPGSNGSRLVLRHRSTAAGAEAPVSANFWMSPSGPSPALPKLMAAIKANDRGGIWLDAPSSLTAPKKGFVGGPQEEHFYYVVGGQALALFLGGLLLWRVRRREGAQGLQR